MVATDNHLGYMESDPVRKDDSFDAFEEIFRIAKAEKVRPHDRTQTCFCVDGLNWSV
jgi:DNA repair exonuclease SbcCD nuclease subunit